METNTLCNRHIGPDESDVKKMLEKIGVHSLDELINQVIPADIRLKEPIELPEPLTEYAYGKHMAELAAKNKLYATYIGMGWYNTITPAVIQRNVFENPVWYTSYTPYQAEISQGRLEALMNFQTAVCDLTGMPLANSSLLDEATAAAEAVTMMHGLRHVISKRTMPTWCWSTKRFFRKRSRLCKHGRCLRALSYGLVSTLLLNLRPMYLPV